MKKLIYTLSFVALLSIAGNAQATPELKQDPAKKEMKKTDPKPATTPTAKEEKAPAGTGTRMAINEKGVPASRAAKEKKDEKAVTPTTSTEKK